MNRVLEDGYVYKCFYTATGSSGGSTTSESGVVKLSRPQSLVPFDELTEAICNQWVANSLGQEGTEAIEARLTARLQKLSNPVHTTGLPWATAEDDGFTP
ncbi:MAG: hypothetical protein GY918_07230 [Gammaproteobacteria bacterium]|nr:hypothetical protein [Gammaproteobacteria bacterium]